MNKHALSRHNLDQAILRQSRQSLSYRCTRDAELFGKLALIEPHILFDIININIKNGLAQELTSKVVQVLSSLLSVWPSGEAPSVARVGALMLAIASLAKAVATLEKMIGELERWRQALATLDKEALNRFLCESKRCRELI